MYPGPATSLFARAARLVYDRSKRISACIAFGYATALLGLGVAFLGVDRPTGDAVAAGIVLLFLSFASLFYVSVSLVTLGRG